MTVNLISRRGAIAAVIAAAAALPAAAQAPLELKIMAPAARSASPSS